ncbi:hypothetical protein D3C81_728050 [compost metagenome]
MFVGAASAAKLGMSAVPLKSAIRESAVADLAAGWENTSFAAEAAPTEAFRLFGWSANAAALKLRLR